MARPGGARRASMCCFRRAGTSTASASTLAVQSYSSYFPASRTWSQTLMKTSVFVSVASPVSHPDFADCQEWKMSWSSQAKTLALFCFASFMSCTSLESGRTAMMQYKALVATGCPAGWAGTSYSVRPAPTNVPFQPAGSGTICEVHVVFLTVCTQPVKMSSLTRQLKPTLQQSLSAEQEAPAQAHPGSYFERLPSALQDQSFSPQLGKHVA
mmetsp:Transcript_478/g.1186  ORF Transcript_478/g.1186 Transcript_478/m.1186 type:complete len:212 (+) Transcript_478:537-1172(+)